VDVVRQLRVGVAGCGEIAQIVHLPILQALEDKYEISALAEPSATVLRAIGDRYRVAHRFADAAQMVAEVDLDVLLILTPNEFHADLAIAAVERGMDVFVEKPMAVSLREATRLLAARDKHGAVVMVGYMRRYSPAFAAAREELSRLADVRYVEVFDFNGPNRMIIDETSRIIRAGDVPPLPAGKLDALLQDALGPVEPDLKTAYGQLIGLGCHDISAMREFIGLPSEILEARQWAGGVWIHAVFDYGDFLATCQIGSHRQLSYSAHLKAVADQATVEVRFPTPYVRHVPAVATVFKTTGTGTERSELIPSYVEPFEIEWQEFYECVRDRRQPKTSVEDSIADLELFRDMINAMRK
jgi:predicted dehydrogenase